jgi:cardiolipin synthase
VTPLQYLLEAGLIGALFHLVLAPIAAVHALISKRDSRAAFGWIGLCFLLPVAGPLIYLVFGVNRIRRRARRLELPGLEFGYERGRGRRPALDHDPELAPEIARLGRIGGQLSGHRLLGGNRVDALENGDQAYPAMIEAIESARRSVFLISYIFDTDRAGRAVIDALAAARNRGVDVRVIVDGVGQWYSWPHAPRVLRRRGVPAARFLPPRLLPPRISINLRTHHKILAVDGCIAFTGGMNIGDGHVLGEGSLEHKVADLHFRLRGPVASQLEEEFLRSWEFVTGRAEPPAAALARPAGSAHCRALSDGPDEDLDAITQLLGAVIAEARQSILIMTPYFLPPRELIGALQAASLRGVEVKLVLPARSNLPYVHWATRNMLWEVLYQGVEVFYQPPPFSHAKLMVVDDAWTLIGSSNWDPRSLRLNFELQVEVFDRDFAGAMAARIRSAAAAGRRVTLEEVDRRSLPVRLRDSFCWLFSPYL